MRLSKLESEVTGEANKALGAATEVIVATLEGVGLEIGNLTVYLEGLFSLAPGAAETSFNLRLRRGSTTGGTELLKEVVEPTVSKKVDVPIQYTDKPGEVAGQAYVLTAESIGGESHTANGCRLHATF